jgi:hypothetical protein
MIIKLNQDLEKVYNKKKRLTMYSGKELIEQFEGSSTDYLWEHLIPRTGSCLLVGAPDLGKSQLAKELVIMVASGKMEYMGQALNPKHNRALYLSTEDGEHSVSSSLKKQLNFHTDCNQDNVQFAFYNGEPLHELVEMLDTICTETPLDLLIIDAFGDIFSGNDSNNNTQMRKDVKAFDVLLRNHNLAIVFVHHINKAGYKKNPSQELIQGGSGLTQKVRSALFLSKNEQGERFFSVAKGNYTPSFYKENKLPVVFDEITLTFHSKGEWIPINSNHASQPRADLSAVHLNEIFSNEGLTYKILCNRLMDSQDFSKSTAERKVNKLLSTGKIIKKDELYFVSSHPQAINLMDRSEGDAQNSTEFTNVQKDFNINDAIIPQDTIEIEGEGNSTTENNEMNTLNHQQYIVDDGDVKEEVAETCNLVEDAISDWYTCDIRAENDSLLVQEESTEGIYNNQEKEIIRIVAEYGGDEEFEAGVIDFYRNGLFDIKKEGFIPLFLLDGILQDSYSMTPNQSKWVVELFARLKLIRRDAEDNISLR